MTFWQIELVLSVMVIDSNYLVLYIFFLNHYLTKRFYFCLFLVILLFHMKGSIFHNFPSFPRTHMSARGRFPVLEVNSLKLRNQLQFAVLLIKPC
jgi:hypothetical protein